MNVDRVSVVISTYNRAAFLAETLAALAGMCRPEACNVEIVVVDNNSTDSTAAVIAEAAAASPVPIRSLFEQRQGKSFALNLALEHAAGEVLALTDDDVLPNPDWLKRIVATFRSRPVSFAFGKVLPRWGVPPPPELLTVAGRHLWGPLAILDFGDLPIAYERDAPDPPLPIGANLAVRRDVLVMLGGWRTDLGRVDNTLISGEDHELFFRMKQRGAFSGYYDPGMVVRHYVPASRLTRRYFRRWFYWHGKTLALMGAGIYESLDLGKVPHIAGIPRFVYRQFAEQCWKWLRLLGSRDAVAVLVEELRTIEYLGFFRQGFRMAAAARPRGKGLGGAAGSGLAAMRRLRRAPAAGPEARWPGGN